MTSPLVLKWSGVSVLVQDSGVSKLAKDNEVSLSFDHSAAHYFDAGDQQIPLF
jgi:hypothetical protein